MSIIDALMKSGEATKPAVYCMMIGLVGIANGYRKFRTRRKIENTARSKISTAPQGLVEVEGQAWPTAVRKSLDGRPVCFWSIEVQEYRKSGKNSSWQTVYTYASSEELLVFDGSGVCLVHPEAAELSLLATIIGRDDMSELQRSFLAEAAPLAARYFSSSKGLWTMITENPVRVVEKKILAGGPVYVRGEFYTSADQSHAVAVGDANSYSGKLGKISSKTYQRAMFDGNKDGKVSEKEFIDGHSAAANIFLRQRGVQSVKIAGKITANSEHGLFLADVHQTYLLGRLATFGSIWGGLALFGVGLFLFFKEIGL